MVTGGGEDTNPPSNLAKAGGSRGLLVCIGIAVFIGATGAAAAGGGVDVMPGILRLANEPFPILLRVARRDAVSTGGATIAEKQISPSVAIQHSQVE